MAHARSDGEKTKDMHEQPLGTDDLVTDLFSGGGGEGFVKGEANGLDRDVGPGFRLLEERSLKYDTQR